MYTVFPVLRARRCGAASACASAVPSAALWRRGLRGVPMRSADLPCAHRHRLPQCAVLLAVALLTCTLLAAMPVMASDSSDSSLEPVYLLNTMYTADTYTDQQAHAIWEGIDAAFYASGYTAAGGRPLKIVSRDTSVNASDIAAVIEKAFADYPSLLGVIGPFGDAQLLAALQSDPVLNDNLMCMAPFTGSSKVRVWNSNAYFTRTEPLAELKALMKYAIHTVRARRIAYVYLSGISYGDTEYAALQSTLSSFSLAAPTVYVSPYSTTSVAVNQTAFSEMADSYPQVIIVWGMPGQQMYNVAKQLFTDARTSAATIMSCFGLQQIMYDAYTAVVAAGLTTMRNEQLFVSSASLPVTSVEAAVQHIPIFHTEMANYIANSGKSQYSLPAASSSSGSTALTSAELFFYEQSNAGAMMLAGWVSGKLIQRTLDRIDWITDRPTYQTGLFDQNRFIIGVDYVLGDYGGTCDALAAATGAMCNCNQGGHTAHLMSLSDAAQWTIFHNGAFIYTQASCYSTNIPLASPLNIFTLYPTDNADMAAIAQLASNIVPAFFAFVNITDISANNALRNCTLETEQAVLDMEVGNYTVDIITGPRADDLDVGDLLVVAPAFPRPRLTIQKQNYIYIMPTLEQEIFIVYANLGKLASLGGSGSSGTLNVVLHGYNTTDVQAISAVFTSTAATFNLADPTITSVASTSAITTALSSTAVNFVIGLTNEDLVVLPAFLATTSSAVVVVDFKDLAAGYDTLMTLFASVSVSVQSRFISFTNMPLWSDTSDAAHAASDLLTTFHELVTDTSNHTPAYFQNVIASVLMLTLSQATSVINSSTLLEALYLNSVFSYGGLTLGQYLWSCSTTSQGQTCQYHNYGAQNIVALSMARMLDPTASNTIAASTPSMVYEARPKAQSGLSKQQLTGAIVGGVVGGLLLIGAIIAIVFCCCINGRDNDAAPKDGAKPVTLVFTDIESSTALWAALPQLMPDAVATHHRLIRQVIRKYKCYEVKTIGDSFMIACKSAHSAVQLANDIQVKFLKYDWGTTLIDESYAAFKLRKQEESPDEKPSTPEPTERDGEALWNGLRVRMGIHTGLSDIRYDEVTKGYDYYGDTSNMAARTEAIANGGQVIMTETTWWAMSDAEREPMNHTYMGPQGLRGVPYAVEMYQLNPVVGRQYAPLRTEIEAVLPDDSVADTNSSAADALLSSHATMTGPASAVALVLSGCFSLYPPAQRVRELQPLLTRWNVPAPPRNRRVSEEDYCQGLVNRLAVRVATVTAARQRLNGGGDAAVSGESAASISVGGVSDRPNPFRAAVAARGSNAARGSAISTGTTPPPEGRSAMRESRVFRKSAVGFLASLRGTSVRSGTGGSATGTGVVVPFGTPATLVGSVGQRSVFGEAPTERLAAAPTEPRRRRGDGAGSSATFVGED